MKKYTTYINSLILIVCVCSTIIACGGKENGTKTADERLGKLEVDIPEELKNNDEVVEYIEGMTRVADEYAILMDDMLEEVGDLSGKEPEELTMMEQLKLVKATGEVAVRSAEIMAAWEEYQSKRNELDQLLSSEEIQALEEVLEHFEARMMQIAEKHEDILVDQTES